nr:hypothetical protein [Nonomuraea sediminis]
MLLFTRPDAHRLDNIGRDPRVSLNLNSTPTGGDVVVITGRAEFVEGDPTTSDAYQEKYADGITRIAGTVEEFAKRYPIPIRVHIDRVRGF